MLNITKEGKITIGTDVLEQSKRAVVLAEDKNLRKKLFASMIAINMFSRYLKEQGINIDARTSLSRIHSVIENIDLSNISYKNLQLDIRVIINGDDLFIPKTHIKNDIIPDIYVAARLNRNLNYIEFLGFIESSKLVMLEDLKEYYSVPVSELSPMTELVNFLQRTNISQKLFDETIHTRVQELFIGYFDNTLSKVEKMYLLRHLFYCMDCRKKFVNFYDFDIVAKCIQQNPEIMSPCDLSIEDFDNETLQLDTATKQESLLVKSFVNKNSDKNEKIKFLELENEIPVIPSKKAQPTDIEHTIKNTFVDNLDLEDDETIFDTLREDIKKNKETRKKNSIVKNMQIDSNIDEKIKNNEYHGINKNREIAKEEKKQKGNKQKSPKAALAKSIITNLEETKSKKKKSLRAKQESLGKKLGKKSTNIEKATPPTDNAKQIPQTKIPLFSSLYNDVNLSKRTRLKKFFVSTVLVSLCAIAICGYSYYDHQSFLPWIQSKVSETKLVKEDITQTKIDRPTLTAAMLDPSQALIDGFADVSNIETLSWEVLPEYAQNPVFVEFLQNSGVSIQTNLQENFILYQVNELKKGSKIIITFSFSKDKGIKNFKFETTSGSTTIDNLIRNSVLSSLKLYTYPMFDEKVSKIDFKLLIDF